eukprot:TRINITY_DN26352_c0_g3_i1.p1 TRINITY_DN26352_c0_g3~~TRINITY_DN26352_c0_g3_i1.p1  ORF type:complete len:188 (-),score=25.92 TRINITY_DN26352_c0_g3_i1:229-792(-)
MVPEHECGDVHPADSLRESTRPSSNAVCHEVSGQEEAEEKYVTQLCKPEFFDRDHPRELFDRPGSDKVMPVVSSEMAAHELQSAPSSAPLTKILTTYGVPKKPAPPEEPWVYHETLWGKPFQRGSHHDPATKASRRSRRRKAATRSVASSDALNQVNGEYHHGAVWCVGSPDNVFLEACTSGHMGFQ